MTIFNFVKLHSGLVQNEAIENLCSKIKLYMIKNEIENITPTIVKEVKKMSKFDISTMEDKRVKK